MKDEERKRKVLDRPWTLDEEIRCHCLMWKNDIQFKHLPVYLRETINSALDAVAVSKSMENANVVVNGDDSKKNIETKKFIAIYRSRYMELTDYECEETFNGTTFVIISNFVKKLAEAGSNVDEYLTWIFETFLKNPANKHLCPPNIGLIICDNIKNKFLFEMKDKLRVRRKDAFDSGRKLKLMKIASTLFDEIPDESLGEVILQIGNNKISFNNAANSVMIFASKNNKPELAEEVEALMKD